VIARVAKERGILTVGVVTLPFLMEGKRRIEKALKGMNDLKQCVDSLIVINNERLLEDSQYAGLD
jgi:cell division protein FtsZ